MHFTSIIAVVVVALAHVCFAGFVKVARDAEHGIERIVGGLVPREATVTVTVTTIPDYCTTAVPLTAASPAIFTTPVLTTMSTTAAAATPSVSSATISTISTASTSATAAALTPTTSAALNTTATKTSISSSSSAVTTITPTTTVAASPSPSSTPKTAGAGATVPSLLFGFAIAGLAVLLS